MANKKITDLMSGTPTRDSLLESAIDISGTMDSRKVTTGAIADLANANVAAAYNSATTYAIGQYCLYEGDIYRCIAITTGTFDATKWTQIVVTGEFRRVVELTTAQYEALSSAEQNNGTLYIITDGIPPSETVTGSDIIPFIDVNDSNKPKSTTAAAVAGLGWAQSTHTASYDNTKINQGNIYAYSLGKIIMITGYMKTSLGDIAPNTQAATVSGVTLTQEIFVSVVGESGSTLRIKAGTDGSIMLEKRMANNEWYSFTMIGFLA